MEAVLNFLRQTVFVIGSFDVQWYMLIAAIVVVLLLVIIIVAAAANKKKKKAKKTTDNADANNSEVINESEQPASAEADEVKEAEVIAESPAEETNEVAAPANETVADEKEPEEAPVTEEIIMEEAPVTEEPVQEEAPAALEESAALEEPVVEEAALQEEKTEEPQEEPKEEKKLSPRKQGLVEISVKKTVRETRKQNKKTEITTDANATEKSAQAPKAKPQQKYIVIKGDPKDTFGKYFITMDTRSTIRPYRFVLKANNGQLLFESEPYKAKPKVASIVAFKKHCANGLFEIDEDKAGNFRFKLYSEKNQLVGVGESYSTKVACENSIESVKKFAESATVMEDTTITDEQ